MHAVRVFNIRLMFAHPGGDTSGEALLPLAFQKRCSDLSVGVPGAICLHVQLALRPLPLYL